MHFSRQNTYKQSNLSSRASSIISNTSGNSLNEEFSDDEYEDDDDFDNIDGNFLAYCVCETL